MSTVVKTLGVLAVLGFLVAGSVIAFGLYNVSARAGHLALVSWFLHTTYENAVRLRAPPPSEVPDLSDPAMIALGARHFDSACRFCHSVPGEIRNGTAESIVPEPPHITEAVEPWQPRHLHWIVYEGVKMSGMPHWPADRPDEVWSVTAFLEEVGTMTEDDYARLTSGPVGVEDQALAYCASCHGMDGVGKLGPYVPRLDILSEAYLLYSLEAYRQDTRASGFMQHAASLYDPGTLRRMARHYADQPAAPIGRQPDPELVALGAALASADPADDDVPACRACHGPEPTETAATIPSLAGQHRRYLERQLRLWRAGERGGGPRANIMHTVATDLTDAHIAALAAYYASLPPAK